MRKQLKFKKSGGNSTDRYRVWLEQARFDLETAKKTMDLESFEWVCYQAIQSVEKALKAVVVHAGYRAPKTHKLGVLISMSNRANKAFENVKLNFRKIEGYTFISRYPFVIPGQNVTPREIITRHDAETCISIAEDIFNKVEHFISERKFGTDKDIAMEDYYFTPEEITERKQQVIDLAANCEAMDVRRVILFGGFARENVQPRTATMDILVIAYTDKSFIERIQYFRELTRGNEPIIEPIVYTPGEFDIMLKEEGEGFLESAIEEGVELFNKGEPLQS